MLVELEEGKEMMVMRHLSRKYPMMHLRMIVNLNIAC